MIGACTKQLTDLEYVQNAKNYLDSGNTQEAIIELKSALVKNPNNPEARWLLGKTYVGTAYYVGAEKELGHALVLGLPKKDVVPYYVITLWKLAQYQELVEQIDVDYSYSQETNTLVRVYRARAYAMLRQSKLAEAEIKDELNLEKETSEIYSTLALIELSKGDVEKARTWIVKSFSIQQTDDFAWYLNGLIQISMNKTEDAIFSFSQAIEHSNDTGLAYRINRGRAYLSKKDCANALPDAKIITGYQKENPQANLIEGVCLFEEKKYKAAQEALERALRGDPGNAEAFFYLAGSHFFSKEYEQAEYFIQKLLARAGEQGRQILQRYLAAIYVQKKEWIKAQEVLHLLVKSNPEDASLVDFYFRVKFASDQVDLSEIEVDDLLNGEKTDDLLDRYALASFSRNNILGGIEAIEKKLSRQGLDPSLESKFLKYLSIKEFAEALKIANQLILHDSSNSHAHSYAGVAYYYLGDRANAEESFRRAQQLAPEESGAISNLGKILVEQGKFEDAKKIYSAAFHAQDVVHIEIFLDLADLELRQSNFGEAFNLWEKAKKKYPGDPRPRIMLARYYLNLGKFNDALSMLEEAKDAHMNNTDFMVLLGRTYLSVNAYSKALACFERLIELTPGSPAAYQYKALTLAQIGDSQGVWQSLNKGLAIDPEYLPSVLLGTKFYLKEDRFEEADSSISKLLAKEPNNPFFLYESGVLAYKKGKFEEALSIFQKVREMVRHEEATLHIARAYIQLGDYEKSYFILSEGIKEFPNSDVVLAELSNILMLLNRYIEAEAVYKQLLEMDPKNVYALNNIAWLKRKSSPSEAKRLALMALGLSPANLAIQSTLAEVYFELGDWSEAVELSEKILVSDPDNLEMKYLLAQSLSFMGRHVEANVLFDEVIRLAGTTKLGEEALRTKNEFGSYSR